MRPSLPLSLFYLTCLAAAAMGYTTTYYSSQDCSGTPVLTVTYYQGHCYQKFAINHTVCPDFLACAGNGRIDGATLYRRCSQYLSLQNSSLLVQSDGNVRSYLASPDCTSGFIPFTPSNGCDARKASASCSGYMGSVWDATSGSASPSGALNFWLRQLLSLVLSV